MQLVIDFTSHLSVYTYFQIIRTHAGNVVFLIAINSICYAERLTQYTDFYKIFCIVVDSLLTMQQQVIVVCPSNTQQQVSIYI